METRYLALHKKWLMQINRSPDIKKLKLVTFLLVITYLLSETMQFKIILLMLIHLPVVTVDLKKISMKLLDSM